MYINGSNDYLVHNNTPYKPTPTTHHIVSAVRGCPDGETCSGQFSDPSDTNTFMYSLGVATAEWNSSRSFKGDMAEVIAFDIEISNLQRIQVTNYLAKKWGLTNEVDSDGDSVTDNSDDFPLDNSAATDTDGDGYPDTFFDGFTTLADGLTTVDDFPLDNSAATDTDSDGYPDTIFDGFTTLADGLTTVDLDDDNDGYSDTIEIAAGTSPIDASDFPKVDLSDSIDAQINAPSGLDSIESDLHLWLDANNIDGLNNSTLSNGASITTWQDSSNKNSHAINKSGSQQPVLKMNEYGSEATVDLESSYLDVAMTSYTTENITIFTVYDKQDVDGWDTFLIIKGSGYALQWMDNLQNKSTNSTINNGYGWKHFTFGTNHTGLNIATYRTTHDEGIIYTNGNNYSQKIGHHDPGIRVQEHNGQNYSFHPEFTTRFGANAAGNNFTDAHLSEVLIFYAALTNDQMTKINYYLSKKWGLTNKVDSDQDGTFDANDGAPMDPNSIIVDDDFDDDGTLNDEDAFPYDASETLDTDNDGIGNNTDSDDDGDGHSDSHEITCESNPLDSNSVPLDNDGDEICNGSDDDDDGDGFIDSNDDFPLDNSAATDTDSDGYPDTFFDGFTTLADGLTTVDLDDDNDGFSDTIEIAAGTSPIDASDSPKVDLSDSIDAQIGTESGLDSIESNLKLWLNASNIDATNNATLTDGDAISTWIDLSGNNHSAIQKIPITSLHLTMKINP